MSPNRTITCDQLRQYHHTFTPKQLVSGKDVDYIESKLSYELENVNNWLVENKVSIHLGKTERSLFAP